MARTLTLLSLAAILAAPAAEARPIRTAAKPDVTAALKSRQSAMSGFNARMDRLDALMGGPAHSATRTRSAEAGR